METVLKNTSIFLKDYNIKPNSEAQVYNAIKLILKVVFDAALFPSESFQKTAKCYKPDILLPDLGCAIEYKYARSESKLIETIDQILIDVNGYANHPIYNRFYAVFYTNPGIWSKKRFRIVLHEKRFPANWKGLLVIGD